MALSPAACNRAITSDQHDPSANSPCTRTTLRAEIGAEVAAMPRLETNEAAEPASRPAEKVRLFIIMICLPFIIELLGRDRSDAGAGPELRRSKC